MGSGHNDFAPLPGQAASAIAALDCHLLAGAGGGVMEAVAAAFVKVSNRRGQSIGIVRANAFPVLHEGIRSWAAKVQNTSIEIAIKTHLPLSGVDGKDSLSRNHVNVLTADVIIVLPGDTGTMAELELAVEYQKPTAPFLGTNKLNGQTVAQLKARFGNACSVATSSDQLKDTLGELLRGNV